MREVEGSLDARDLQVGVAVSSFNQVVTEGLLEGALRVLKQAGGQDVTVVRVPGAWELPLAVRRLAEAGCQTVVALGALIEGETDHYRYLAAEASAGLRQVMLERDVAVGFGVLTVRRLSQARERSLPGPGNKGAEAAEAAVRTAMVLRALRRGSGAGTGSCSRPG
ncbi:MAG: 6,7-dimethyl-8-ribityllumazine synthase [Actinomycetota bacterium]|nr:6,7-dimethyl-8-ribityllumazine synthase [Actinomycetota bacterium]